MVEENKKSRIKLTIKDTLLKTLIQRRGVREWITRRTGTTEVP